MIYELRQYVPVPGREADLRRRFADSTLDLFARLGFRVLDFWEASDGKGDLWYLMEWADEAAMQAAWDSFRRNPEWLSIKAETEGTGALAKSINSIPLRRAEFFGRTKPEK